MSEGATASAPARACERATFASSGSVASLSTCAVAEDAARAVRGVLAQAHVRQHGQSRRLGPDGADRALHGAGVVPGRRPLLILAIGQSEQEHAADPAGLGLRRQARGDVGRDVALAGERRDRAVDARAGDDEQRLHEIGRRDARLAHEATQPLGPSQAAHANSGKAHPGSLDGAPRSTLRRPDTQRMGGTATHSDGVCSTPIDTPDPTWPAT